MLSDSQPLKVFISYSHDSSEHKDLVLELSDRLRHEGIDCDIDQYEEFSPPEGWPRWIEKQIQEAKFVLTICTETFYNLVMGEEITHESCSVRWQIYLVYQNIYNQGTFNQKFIPVLFEKGKLDHIPPPLRGATSYFAQTEKGYEDLYRRLTNQPSTPKLPLGLLRSLPPRDRQQFFLEEPEHRKLLAEFRQASQGLLKLPRTIGPEQIIPRPELGKLLNRLQEQKYSTTVVLGSPGSGKSALLATLGHHLVDKGFAVLAIKADYLSEKVGNLEDLRCDDQVNLTMNLRDAVKAVANQEKVIVLIDQLDAVSELLDRKTERLNVLLNLIQALNGIPQVHIVATVREFEFRQDSRFARLENVETMQLSLPEWSDIVPILQQAGHNPPTIGQSLQDLLRTPLHLKLFLEVAQPGDVFDSLQALLAELWEQRVFKGEANCIEFLEELAEQMRDEEVLWLPASVADRHQQAYQVLRQAEILTKEKEKIGFRHQTYYDYTLARAFARGSKSLADLVLERQDGLFVRPILLSSLNYLRGTNRQQYGKQLQILLSNPEQNNCLLKNKVSRQFQKLLKLLPGKSKMLLIKALSFLKLINLRTHIYSLLIDFVGQQQEPAPVEIDLLVPLLNSETEGQRVLRTVAGSRGWFHCLRNRSELEQWLIKPINEARYCLPLLINAVHFAAENVWNIMEEYWLENPDYDSLSTRVIWECEQWTAPRVKFATRVIRRSDTTDWSSTSDIAERVTEDLPKLSSHIIRAYLDRRLALALEESKKPKPELPADADEVKRYLHNSEHHPLKPFDNLLKENLYKLETFAKDDPQSFLNALWPWFIKIIDHLVEKRNKSANRYLENSFTIDIWGGGAFHSDIAMALSVAISHLAKKDSPAFWDFLAENINSEWQIVHCLLVQGLQKIASEEPQQVLSYLLGNSRRLCLGGYDYYFPEKKQLISSVFPHLKPSERRQLEQAVLAYKRNYNFSENTAEERRRAKKWQRQDRLRLLRAFPEDCLSPENKRFREEEERALPNTDDYGSRIVGGTIGPRITAGEMAKASDEDLLNLFDRLPDETGSGIDRYCRDSIDFSRSGGASQLSEEFGKLAKIQPERVFHLIQKLSPSRQETYAAKGLRGLAETEFPADDIITRAESLHRQGFTSEDFQHIVASALGKVAERNNGLPPSTLLLLENWLRIQPELLASQEEKESKPWSLDSSILFHRGGIHLLPQSRGYIIHALASGYLKQEPPNLQGWAKLIRSRLSEEKHPEVWIETVSEMPLLLNWNRLKATELFDTVIRNCPPILQSAYALYHIAHCLGWFEPKETVQSWLELLLAEESSFCHQAYGELLLVQYVQYQDEWSVNRIDLHLNEAKEEAILCGLAHAASYLWKYPRVQVISTKILATLASHPANSVQKAVARLFWLVRDTFELNLKMKPIVQAVSENQPVLLASADNLIEIIEPLTAQEPAIVSQVCQNVIKAIGEDFNDTTVSWVYLSESLTNIAITLHRQPDYRQIGLELFEQLLALNVREARTALELLDRNPQRRGYLPVRRRRRSASS